MSVPVQMHHQQARDGYKNEIRALMEARPNVRVLELGAGRWPMFALDELPSTVASYTVNDLDPALLSQVPKGYETACFDVTSDAHDFYGKYDLVFSHFLVEHVRDGIKFHRNVFNILAPGGVAIHLHPTLFSFPFVINKILPEQTTHSIVKLFRRKRIERGYPKFPAHYSYCRASETKMRGYLLPLGFEDVRVRAFYGHPYYDNIPVVKQLGNIIAGVCARYNLESLASYAYVRTQKRA
ncbi:class I SAM-dependent methyltransferase [Methylobacterium sp. V23]|uniref:class I SAM-dependent methyltransferase n=1 Tax=Methylobacterium sp. V23 TaxID=2044878 RepID=UPI000CDA0D6A|nr:class I SAM-dependent methyltransferase [Methylobacterium sp. V23]POR39906.1 hypothetical protein CRT23_26870 [Methylobacterium sp. V23]